MPTRSNESGSIGRGRRAMVIGAGLAGSLLAKRLADLGFKVRVYERRADPRAKGYVGGRSINLALSVRGLDALALAGLDELVRREAIPMPGRMVHARDGALAFQPYSKTPGEAINSVSRGGLNLTLIRAADEHEGVEFFFDHRCVEIDFAHDEARFVGPGGAIVRDRADLIVSSDGAFSAGRLAMQMTDRFEYSQSYLAHGYKELHIPARADGSFAMERGALHIWPRSSAMMIALPNPDASFTCTLFWPFEGEHSFANLRTREEVRAFFDREYADAVPLMPTLLDDYERNPTSSLVTVRCRPWRVGPRTALLGDAAHAIVPFYGQGMNCAFEDVTALVEALRAHGGDVAPALAAYEEARRIHADAIADMAIENFVEMRDKVGSPAFRWRKRLEQLVHELFPDRWVPQYNLVSFSTVPYAQARARGRRMEELLDVVVARVDARGEPEAQRAQARQAVEEFERGERGMIEIGPVIDESLAVWPGDTKPTREVLLDQSRGDSVTLSTLRATVHLGAHADGANHYGVGAPSIEAMPVDRYVGECEVMGVRTRRGARVGVGDLPRTPTSKRLLLRTGTNPDAASFAPDFCGLEPTLVRHLHALGVALVGIDTPSVDLMESKDLPAHRAFLECGMSIVEGLDLTGVDDGRYELLAQPLRLKGFDASPVRPLLRRLGAR